MFSWHNQSSRGNNKTSPGSQNYFLATFRCSGAEFCAGIVLFVAQLSNKALSRKFVLSKKGYSSVCGNFLILMCGEVAWY